MDTVIIRIDRSVRGQHSATLRRFDVALQSWSAPIAEGPLGELPALAELGSARDPADAIVTALLTLDGVSTMVSKIGSHLHTYLTTNAVGEKWQLLMTAPLHTVLDIRDPKLRRLPWELLCGDVGPVFTDPERPLVRGDIAANRHLEPFVWPLRVLLVVGFPPDDRHADHEIQEIENAFRPFRRMVEMEVLERPPHEELEAAFRTFRPHIFHFIGHGKADPGTGQPMLEIIDRSSNVPWRWSKEQINFLFQSLTPKWVPRLVFLNACRSGQLSSEEQLNNRLSLWSLAEVVQARGVSAVVSMHADIRQDLAPLFSRPLYEDLLRGKSIDQALASRAQPGRVGRGGAPRLGPGTPHLDRASRVAVRARVTDVHAPRRPILS